MRTPLGSILFFVKEIQKMVLKHLKNPAEIRMAKKYFSMIIAQIIMMQTYVDDLLDVR